MGFNFPYGNKQQLNIDWFLRKFKELVAAWNDKEESIDGALDAEIQKAEDALTDVYTARDVTVAAKNDALQAKADALTAAANAAQYWQNAANSAQSAAGSAVNALQAEQDANTYAGNAAASAQSASSKALQALTQAGRSEQQALKSEGHAVGEQEGVPVASDSPYYHNNAKYYAEQAAQDKDDTDTIKDNANAAALRAEGWADGTQNGAPVTSGSPYYENNAKFYKEAAEDVLDSIPPEYSDLAAEVAAQSEKFDEIGYRFDFNEITEDAFKFSADVQNTTKNGVTFTKIDDRTLKLNGTATTAFNQNLAMGSYPITEGYWYFKIDVNQDTMPSGWYFRVGCILQDDSAVGYIVDINEINLVKQISYPLNAKLARHYMRIPNGASFNNTILTFHNWPKETLPQRFEDINRKRSNCINFGVRDYIDITFKNGHISTSTGEETSGNGAISREAITLNKPVIIKKNPDYQIQIFEYPAGASFNRVGFDIGASQYIFTPTATSTYKFEAYLGNGSVTEPLETMLKKFVISYLEDDASVNKSLSYISGRRWATLGDSLTDPVTLSVYSGEETKNYTNIVAERLGLTLTNLGKSGSGYWRKSTVENPYSFYHKALEIPSDTKIVTIFGSFNDMGRDGDIRGRDILGTIYDDTTDTVGGCINQTFKNIIATVPDAVIGVILPTPWDDMTYTEAQMTIYEPYVNLVKGCAERFSLPVLDLFHHSNLRPWLQSFREKYYINASDGDHPNHYGHERISGMIEEFVLSLAQGIKP